MNLAGPRLARNVDRVSVLHFHLTIRAFTTSQSSWNAPSWRDELRSRYQTLVAQVDFPRRKNDVVMRASAGFSDLGRRLNFVTGYDEIERLKNAVYVQGM